jgi:hypothetical protein
LSHIVGSALFANALLLAPREGWDGTKHFFNECFYKQVFRKSFGRVNWMSEEGREAD